MSLLEMAHAQKLNSGSDPLCPDREANGELHVSHVAG